MTVFLRFGAFMFFFEREINWWQVAGEFEYSFDEDDPTLVMGINVKPLRNSPVVT